MPDPYKTLGVAKNAKPDELKRAYRKKAAAAHPDRKGGDAAAMAEVNQAYALLTDQRARERYDRTGQTNTPKNAEAMAREMFLGVVKQQIQSNVADNLIERARQFLRTQVTEQATHLAVARQQQRMLDQQRGKIKAKKKSDTLLTGLFEQMQQEYAATIEKMETNIEGLEGAIKLCDNYESMDEATQSTFMQAVSGARTAYYIGGTGAWR